MCSGIVFLMLKFFVIWYSFSIPFSYYLEIKIILANLTVDAHYFKLTVDIILFQGKQPVLNYVEIEFSNPPSNKIPVQRKDSKTQYADVIVKNKSIVVH
jgi:hypothetical protein